MQTHFLTYMALALSACGRMDLETSSAGPDSATDKDARRCTFQGFAPAVVYPTANEPLSILAVDRTHDGHLDLVVGEESSGNASSELFINAGNGTFTASSTYGASGNNVMTMVVADFNGDGRLDLASHSNAGINADLTDHTTGRLGIDFGTGGGLFASQLITYATPQTDGFIAAGDFDGDGHPDLAFAGNNMETKFGGLPAPEPTDYALNVFLNAGDGTFGAPVVYANPNWLQFANIATGDFNGDGHVDIAELTSTTTTDGGVTVYFNQGDGSFASPVALVANSTWSTYGIAVADFNGDGIDDVATTTVMNVNEANEATVIDVFLGASNGSFIGPVSSSMAMTPVANTIVTGDFNGDGLPDVAMLPLGNMPPLAVSVFPNRGDGTFAAPVTYGVGGEQSEWATGIAAGDFNGDGVTDLAVTMSGESTPTPLAMNVLLSICE